MKRAIHSSVMNIKCLKLISFTLSAFFALSLVSAHAQQLIVNGDFELTDFTGDQQDDPNLFPSWVGTSGHVRGDELATWNVPDAVNQVLRQGAATAGNVSIYQDLSYNWSASDTFLLSFNAVGVGWQAGNIGDVNGVMTVSLRQQDGTELWSQGATIFDHPGVATTWTDGTGGTVDMTFGYTIAGSAFTAGTPGEPLRLQLTRSSGTYWVDNVSLSVVPEPSSFAFLAGMFGLTWVMLRRRA